MKADSKSGLKAGTFIRLPDGREATIVYSGLDGFGIIWGKQEVDVNAIEECCPLLEGGRKNDIAPEPEAMLREPYRTASFPCVGEEIEIIED